MPAWHPLRFSPAPAGGVKWKHGYPATGGAGAHRACHPDCNLLHAPLAARGTERIVLHALAACIAGSHRQCTLAAFAPQSSAAFAAVVTPITCTGPGPPLRILPPYRSR